ncbi:AAA family ATPase [Cellulomonas fengjieae]|uniref:CobQ/CobB/MinD/ParA nucleotide binding domain-containing protein n=1 Tax=Cellulomonas fengjieae TaxID=2819978 RepID=A0ABS3SE17_9CELL|nr:hypothetical protein [Cellulomonas fengjieae]MBO3083897.1 hypothetical protein [Cellulomonas fengjieae]MBO3101351.1 hypothetical protein [Cellulomonas fengjieae]QVI64820.1 hypothetical protein KG102_11705 [Cellulomonas fengjieae]
MAVGVLCAVQGSAEAIIVQAVEQTGGRLSVTRRCADLTELLAAAEAGLGRLAVVSGDLDLLDRETIELLHRAGVRVLGIGDAARPWLGERLETLGADLVAVAPHDEASAGDVVRAALAMLASAPDEEPPAGQPDAVRPPARGLVVAVWGPTGAPGRTTVAVNVAAELAAAGRRTLLVDADTYGGCVAQVVGMLDEAPGLAAAARAAGHGALDLNTLARLTPTIATDLRVLSGISRADRWPELPSSSLDAVWPVARALAQWTVVDCGFCLEQDEVLSYDTRAPRRNAATLSALDAADVVLVVGSGDPVGIQRLVRGLGELTDLGLGGTRVVVVNRVRSSVAGAHPAEAIADALARYAGVTDACIVPDDRPALDTALLEARTLREAAPGSPARRALGTLAARVDALLAPAPVAEPVRA